jgi:hypothetical protein
VFSVIDQGFHNTSNYASHLLWLFCFRRCKFSANFVQRFRSSVRNFGIRRFRCAFSRGFALGICCSCRKSNWILLITKKFTSYSENYEFSLFRSYFRHLIFFAVTTYFFFVDT